MSFNYLWEFKETELLWQAVCRETSLVTGQQLLPSPILCLLGLIPGALKVPEEPIPVLLMLVRKAVTFKWVGLTPLCSRPLMLSL